MDKWVYSVAYQKIVAHIYIISITVESLQLLIKCAQFTQQNGLSCPAKGNEGIFGEEFRRRRKALGNNSNFFEE